MPVKHGSEHHAAKLTDEQVIAIRKLYHSTCECCGVRISGAMLARRFGVSTPAVHYVAHGMSRVKG